MQRRDGIKMREKRKLKTERLLEVERCQSTCLWHYIWCSPSISAGLEKKELLGNNLFKLVYSTLKWNIEFMFCWVLIYPCLINKIYVTFRSRLPVPGPAVTFGLCLCFWKPTVVDHRAGFFLDGSSGPTGTSPGTRSAREGSLLRRTWRGMPVEGRVEYKEGGKKR